MENSFTYMMEAIGSKHGRRELGKVSANSYQSSICFVMSLLFICFVAIGHSESPLHHVQVKCQFIEIEPRKEGELILSLDTTKAQHNQGVVPWYSTPCILISQLVWKVWSLLQIKVCCFIYVS